ncbi:MAG TPA: hypothetical protein PKD45_15230 [Flavobacteriales bacterium]|nr:hypothetical protein [Flavobacteriales bacterium]
MSEFDTEIRGLMKAITLIESNKAKDRQRAVEIIFEVCRELRGHDCSESPHWECENCARLEMQLEEELPDVRECLELGLPALVEKYGLNSVEARTAQEVIEAQQ